MKAMIMAAGLGTRLGKITETIPKVLLDINGKSVLEIAVEKCTRAGFDEIIINIHHLADKVLNEIGRLKRNGYKLSVSDERDMLLDTGGGLYKARDFFDSSPFLLYNADILTDLDIQALYKYHQDKKGIATLAVRNRKGNRYFLVNSQGLLSGWCNKATGERIVKREEDADLFEIAFSGLHIIDPSVFSFMKEGKYSMTSLYLEIIPFRQIFTYKTDDGYWFDIGTQESLAKAREFLSTITKESDL